MMRFGFCVLLFGVVVAGCGRNKPPPPPAVPPPTAEAAGPDGAPPAQFVAPPPPVPAKSKKPAANQARLANGRGLNGIRHDFMTQQLRIFRQQFGRMPDNFGEFANARMDSVPRVPEGFRWAIDEETIEVKLVRQ